MRPEDPRLPDEVKRPLLDDDAYAQLLEDEMRREGFAADEVALQRLRQRIEAKLDARQAPRGFRWRWAAGPLAAAALVALAIYTGRDGDEGQRLKGGEAAAGMPVTLEASLYDAEAGTRESLRRDAALSEGAMVLFEARLRESGFVALAAQADGGAPRVVGRTGRLEAGAPQLLAEGEGEAAEAYAYLAESGVHLVRYCAFAAPSDEALTALLAQLATSFAALPPEACVWLRTGG